MDDVLWYAGPHEVGATDPEKYKGTLYAFLRVLRESDMSRDDRSDRRKVNGVIEEWRAEPAETFGLLPFTEAMSERLRDNTPPRELESA